MALFVPQNYSEKKYNVKCISCGMNGFKKSVNHRLTKESRKKILFSLDSPLGPLAPPPSA